MFRRSVQLLLSGLLLTEALVIPRHATPVSKRQIDVSRYDFVIAGGGVAGLTLADRLTEDANVWVLVIESGPFDQREDGVLVPGAWDGSLYTWKGLMTEPQTALNDRSMATVCGHVVGGGSTANAMVWVRGTASDFDGWESLFGSEGWGWDSMLSYYKKSENFTAPEASFAKSANITWDDSVRGHDGPLQYSYPNYFYPGTGHWVSAAESIGMKHRNDPNGGTNSGIFNFPLVLDAAASMTRSYARTVHYDRVKDSRPNYHILPEHTVARIVLEDGRATGVQYLPTDGGDISTVSAAKEVIVTAGALHTPQILQLSGIGPKKLLESLDIPVVVDLPGVGQNLQDQYTLPVTYKFDNGIMPNITTFNTNTTWNQEQRDLYDAHEPSAYTITKHLSVNFGFLSLSDAVSSTEIYDTFLANFQAHNPADSLPADVDPSVLAGYEAQRKLTLQQFELDEVSVGSVNWDTDTFVQIFNLKPLSRGALHINSTDPLANPIIDYRAATDPADFELLTILLRKQRELMAAPDMAALGPVEQAPLGDSVQTDEEILAASREALQPSNGHQCCTAPMLPRDLGGVVSPDLKVYGVEGLRVADISLWPMVLSGPPTATMYAVGEKVADIVKDEHCLDGHC